MTRTEQAIERLDTLVQQNGALVQQNNTLTGILEVCDMNAEENALGKKKIVQAIIKMGGSASEDDSLFALAAAIKKLKTLDPRTVVTDDLPRPVNVGTYICQPELLKNKIVHLYSDEVVAATIDQNFRNSVSLKSIYLGDAKNANESAFSNTTSLEDVIIDGIESLSTNFFQKSAVKRANLPNCKIVGYNSARCGGLQVLNIPLLNNVTGGYSFMDASRLIDMITGWNIKCNITFVSYNPTEAYSKTSASLVDKGEPFSTNNQKWNYNLREHFAANLDDRTGLDAFTITFGSTVLAQMEEATIEAFTSKNWTLA